MRPVTQHFHGQQSLRPSPASSMISAGDSASTTMHQPPYVDQHMSHVNIPTVPVPGIHTGNQSDNIRDTDSVSMSQQPGPDHDPEVQEQSTSQELLLEWSSKTKDTTYRYNVSARMVHYLNGYCG